jgi:MoxR-like ATPase
MNVDHDWQAFKGSGTPRSTDMELAPPLLDPTAFGGGDGYVVSDALRDAVNVAIALGQPLLLTGAPGCGKTRLADAIAYELRLPKLSFHTKTTSTARDLLYTYDALRRFHDAQDVSKKTNVEQYIEYQALGLAIILSMDRNEANEILPEGWFDDYFGDAPRDAHEEKRRARTEGWWPPRDRPTRSVVLVDEIDKAPRDLPNDLLDEFEGMRFEVREVDVQELEDRPRPRFAAPADRRPIVILTSNSERDLPDAFLRRCVYYHIPFPDEAELKRIVERRLGLAELVNERTRTIVDAAVKEFLDIRERPLDKQPATGELLAWLRVLQRLNLDVSDPAQRDAVAFTYSVLAKTQHDLDLLRGDGASARRAP